VRADPTYRPVRRPTARIAPPHLNLQLRRDLLGAALVGFLPAMIALIVAPGLAVIAIASIPVTLVVVGTVVAERRSRKRRHRDGPRANQRAGG
jgi:hypothetical protein